MRVIKDVINESQCLALARGYAGARTGDCVKILNIFYECNSNYKAGLRSHLKLPTSQRHSESPASCARFTWLAWGNKPSSLLTHAKTLLSPNVLPNPFFFDASKGRLLGRILQGMPTPHQYPAHPIALRLCHAEHAVSAEIAKYL
jgi:hypothetical protein